MKYYIVQEIGYEYNDEVYNPANDYAGKPVKVFKDENSAEQHALELSINNLRRLNIGEFGYGKSDIFKRNGKPLDNLITKIYGNVEEDSFDDLKVQKDVSDEDLKSLIPYLRNPLYEVVECED